MKNRVFNFVLSALMLTVLLVTTGVASAQTGNSISEPTRSAGKFYAASYGKWKATTTSSVSATSASIFIDNGFPVAATGGTQTLTPFSSTFPFGGGFINITIGVGAGSTETVTLTGTTGCNQGGAYGTCGLTATYANAHGNGEPVTSGTFGLQEAINDAALSGGGVVVVDPNWVAMGGTSAMINAALVAPNVVVEDDRFGIPRYWSGTATGIAIAAPTGVPVTGQAACDATHQMCSDANVAGSASWSGAVFACTAYVDIYGNEGPCSATTTWTSVASKAIDIASPAAKTGAVGYTVYLSLSGGTYAQAYQIPITSSVCTMTVIETVTPACAVTNTSYNQVGSTFGANTLFNGGAQITGYPVNTAMHFTALATTAETLAAQTPLTNSSVSYSYAPANRVGGCQGMSSSNIVQLAATSSIAGSSATTVPNPLATWTVPSGCFNYIGAEFIVSGKFTFTDGGDSSTHIIISWDANGTNTTTVPLKLCDILDTATGTGAAYNGTYFCDVRVLTTGATGTALVNGYGNIKLAAGASTLVRDSTDIAVAASGSIALNTNARIVVQFEGVGATNNPGAQGLSASLAFVN